MTVFQDSMLEQGLREFHNKEDGVPENVVVPVAYTMVIEDLSEEVIHKDLMVGFCISMCLTLSADSQYSASKSSWIVRHKTIFLNKHHELKSQVKWMEWECTNDQNTIEILSVKVAMCQNRPRQQAY